jgi:hypothetical protein
MNADLRGSEKETSSPLYILRAWLCRLGLQFEFVLGFVLVRVYPRKSAAKFPEVLC